MKLKKMINIKESDIFLLIGTLIVIVAYIFIKIFSYKSEPLLLDYAEKKSINIISSIINNSINNVIYNNKYDDVILIEKDSNGNITSLDFNNTIINNILYLTTNDILNNINILEKTNSIYYVPIGIIYNNPVLINISPKIPFKMEFLGSVNNETMTNVKEYGINSSMIEIFIIINMKVQIILPFKSKTVSVDKKILLDSKIVQGNIPNYYGGIISSALK